MLVSACPEHGIVVAYKCDNVKQTLWSFWWLHFGFSAHGWVVTMVIQV